MNVVAVRGSLSRPPERRELSNGSHLVTYEVTVARSGERAESVPVSWADPPPAADAFGEGEEVVVVGRVRRRFFRAGGATQSRTEVVAEVVLKGSQRAKVRSALRSAGERLAGELG